MTSPLTAEHIEFPAADGIVDSYFARPDDTARHPGVLFYMDAFGLRPWLREMVEAIAAHGYTVLAPNIFYRSGRAPVLPMPDPSDLDSYPAFFAALEPVRATLTPEKAMADAGAYLDRLSASEFVLPGPLGVTGYCMGGRLALRTAAEFGDRVAAAASFHGGHLAADDQPDSPHHAAERITAELLIAHAEADPSMPAEEIARLEAALDAAKVRYTSVVYPQTKHGFTMCDTAMFSEDAYARHLRDLLALLGRAFPATTP